MPANKSWKQHNESPIGRGTCLIDVSFLKKQRQELEKTSRNKIGAPYRCTDSQIGLLTGPHIGFGTACRTVQGVCRGLSEVVRIPEIHFTQTRRGMLRLRPETGNPNPEDAVGLASGSSGPSVTNNGTCLEHKWKRQGREYARLRASSDLKSEKIVSYKIRTGTVLIRNSLFPCLGMQRDAAP